MRPITVALAGWRTAFARRTVEGNPLTVGERTIVPLASITTFSLSGLDGRIGAGTATVQPIAIRVADASGTRVIPIRDVTRSVVMAIFLGATLVSFAARMAIKNKQL